jgi:uncharacterized protein YeaO (DUF488 family)
MSDIRVKRAYRAARRSDGQRVLVDRIWPRGLAKDRLRLDAWAKELAPSTDLRAWFGHDPGKWEEFCRRYGRELDGKPEEVEALRQRLRDGPVTLVYGAKDEEHNNALALKGYLERQERGA